MTEKDNVPLEKPKPVEEDLKVRGVEALRSAKTGWEAIREGKKESRRERLLREQQERGRAIRNGRRQPAEEGGWKPGDDETYADEAPSLKKLMESHSRMQEQNRKKSIFKGTPEMVVLKMVTLFEESTKKPQILSVEESGFNEYSITFIAD